MNVDQELQRLADPVRAKNSAWYFKTGPGQYAEGDVFIGVPVPMQRAIAKKYKDIPMDEIDMLLTNPVHEFRLTALFILCHRFKKDKRQVYDYYLQRTTYVNNWDLVDSSAPIIVGQYLLEFPKELTRLNDLAASSLLWERRIAMISCFAFIRADRFDVPIDIALRLLSDKHDLIHKAVGWMLREVGKRNESALIAFLDEHACMMPRTALRYAIEKFDSDLRTAYLAR